MRPVGSNIIQPSAVSSTKIAERTQQPLGVVARAAGGLAQGHRHLARDAGEQQTALDLRARHGHVIAQTPQPAAADGQRQTIAHHVGDASAHLLERHRDAPHRAASQRSVAGQAGAERVSREHAEEEPRGRCPSCRSEAWCRAVRADPRPVMVTMRSDCSGEISAPS
jgi:hypothetical protein